MSGQRIGREGGRGISCAQQFKVLGGGGPGATETGVVAFFQAGIEADGDFKRGIRKLRFGNFPAFPGTGGRTGPAEDGDDSIRMGGKHQGRPESAPGMTPQAPGCRREFRMAGALGQILESALEYGIRTVAWVTPQAAFGLIAGVIVGGKDGRLVTEGQRLPVEIQGGGVSRTFRAIATAMLVDEDGAHPRDLRGKPQMKRRGDAEFAGLMRSGVIHTPRPLSRRSGETEDLEQQEKKCALNKFTIKSPFFINNTASIEYLID